MTARTACPTATPVEDDVDDVDRPEDLRRDGGRTLRPTVDVVEDVEWMAGTGESFPGAAATDLTPEQARDLLELEQLAAEEAKLAADAAAIAERRETIKAILRDRLPVGTHDVAGYKVQVKAGARRLNSKRLTAAYPFDRAPELYSVALDTAKVKDHVAPAHLIDFYDAGAPTVVVS